MLFICNFKVNIWSFCASMLRVIDAEAKVQIPGQ